MFSKKLVAQRNVFKYVTAKIFKKFTEYWKKLFFNLVRPLITKKSTNWRQPIHAEVKLSVTLRYLATGETFESLMYQFRVHSSTIARFIPIVYQTIYNELQDIYLQMPSTETEWEAIAPKIAERWQYPNCIGKMSALHIQKTVDLIFSITNHFLALYF